jgi:DNA-binding NtrC family response regulator
MVMYNIAVVDDELEILSMVERFLSRSGKFKVTTFSNPVVAVDAVISGDYDVVLMDIMMPQMNGIDALEKIKEIKDEQKVIMMTAYSTLDKVLKSHKEGATNYVMKPFESLSILENKLLTVISE